MKKLVLLSSALLLLISCSNANNIMRDTSSINFDVKFPESKPGYKRVLIPFPIEENSTCSSLTTKLTEVRMGKFMIVPSNGKTYTLDGTLVKRILNGWGIEYFEYVRPNSSNKDSLELLVDWRMFGKESKEFISVSKFSFGKEPTSWFYKSELNHLLMENIVRLYRDRSILNPKNLGTTHCNETINGTVFYVPEDFVIAYKILAPTSNYIEVK